MAPAAPYCLHVLGPVVLRPRDDAGPAESRHAQVLTQPLPLALLSYLLLARPRGAQPRDTLVQLLWPHEDAAHGRRGLRNALYLLRQVLGHDAIVSIGERLVAIDPQWVTCDALLLERCDPQASHEVQHLCAPDAIPFAGLELPDATPFMAWVDSERERLRALQRVDGMPHSAVAANGQINESGSVPASTSAMVAAHGPPHAGTAYSAYLRGHFLFLRAAHGGVPLELEQSRVCFERALTLQPDYPPALAGLANYHAVSARRGALSHFHDAFARAIEYSQRAAMLDPSLAIPHVHFGVQALYLDNAWERAGREFATAVFKEPEYAEGRRFLGVWLGLAGRPVDAVREMEAAARIEPDIPHILSSLSAARLAAGDVRGAEEALRRTLWLDPAHRVARDRLLRLLEDAGRYADALELAWRHPAWPAAQRYQDGWDRDGACGYQDARLLELREELDVLEARVVEQGQRTVNDLFAPPEVRLVQLLRLLGEHRRARAWQLQACASRPILSHWFDMLPPGTHGVSDTSVRPGTPP